jgi:hypothetical protein
MRAHGLVLVSLLAFGCGSNAANDANGNGGADAGAGDSSVSAGRLPCEVDAILETQCRSCHGASPKFGAPMPLVTLGDVQAYKAQIKDRINRSGDSAGRMPQAPNPALGASDLATMNAWLSGGTPAGTGDCSRTDAGPPPAPKPLSCTPDVNLRPKSAWTMTSDLSDVYVCYGFELDTATKKHITGIAPKIDNDKVVHHILLMQADAPVDGTPVECAEGSIARYRMLYAWAPGVGSFELPKEAGLPAEPGKGHYVVQIHYNSVNLKGASGVDNSGFDLCTSTELRPNDADVLAFGSMKFTIPPKSKHDITASWKIPAFLSEVRAIGTFPHMHQLGKSLSTTLVRADGSTADLGTNPAFDFDNQFFLPLPNVVIKAGDTVKTRCVWENPSSNPVGFGENTNDEMCYGFTMYYPKLTSTMWSWAAPSFLATTTVN